MKHKYPQNQFEVDENRWEETTEAHYHEMLGCVPPIRMGRGAFMVGECSCHLNIGEPVYDCYIKVDGRYWHKPLPLKQFDVPAIMEQVYYEINRLWACWIYCTKAVSERNIF